MLTAPKPRSKNRRWAASTIASRDPLRRALGMAWLEPPRFFIRYPLAHMSASHYILWCIALIGTYRCILRCNARPGNAGREIKEQVMNHLKSTFVGLLAL